MRRPIPAERGAGDQATAARTILSLKEVTRDYGAGVRTGPVSCDVAEGEFVSLLGPSGCGKTTLLRSIAGFEPVSGGRIEIASRPRSGRISVCFDPASTVLVSDA